jgi:outer membrane lipoprotein carrier protein
MVSFKKILCFVMLQLICITAIAADASTEALTKLLLDIHTMQAHFTQSINDKSAKSLQQSEGKMSLSRPGKFRWETTSPSAQLIIANGSSLWIYDADLEQVTIRTVHKAAGQTPALLLSDKSLTLSRDFNVKTVPVTAQIAGMQVFLLTPKSKNDAFASIQITFLNHQIHEMRLSDRLGHITTITFHQVKTGLTLSDALFTFKPAANIDVIDETKNQR